MRNKYDKYEMLLAGQQVKGTNKPSKIHDRVKNTGTSMIKQNVRST